MRALAPAVSLALAVAACGGPDRRPLAGSFHLDPRLADGSSSAQALADALVPRVLRPDELDRDGASVPTGPDGSLRVLPSARVDGRPTARIPLADRLEARTYELVRAEVQLPADAPLVLTWNGPLGPSELRMEVGASREPGWVPFRVGSLAAWGGTVTDLALTCEGTGFALTQVELVPVGFRFGYDPPSEGERVAGRRGDCGLRERGHDARRAWPADHGIALYDALDEVPRAGTLSVAVTRGNALLRDGRELWAAVDARARDGAWVRVASLRVPEADTERLGRWTDVTADLSGFAGGPVELRFLASPGEPAPADEVASPEVAPRREALLWGAPVVSGEQPAGRRPNVVLITLDTMRFDALDPATTPNLDALAQRGLSFVNAWSACNSTTPSHASILTGLPPQAHGAVSNRHVLQTGNRTLAEALRELGYVTAAAVSTGHVQANVGFGQGFDAFGMMFPDAGTDGALTLHHVSGWMEAWDEAPDRPFFLWLHLFDPHTPYASPPAWVEEWLAESGLEPPPRTAEPPSVPVYGREGSGGLQGIRGITNAEYVRYLYDLGVSYADHLTGLLVSALDERDVTDDTVFAVVADHGESLGEHGVWCAHYGLHEENLKVPLLLALPPSLGASHDNTRGLVVDELVSSLDLMPTLLAITGAPVPDGLPGENLLQAAFGAADPDRVVWFEYSDQLQAGFRDGEHHFVTTLREFRYGTDLVEVDGALVPRPRPKIPAGTSFLYAHGSDPALENDLAPDDPDAVAAGLERLEAWRGSMRAIDAERRTLSAEEEEQLRNLGYTGED